MDVSLNERSCIPKMAGKPVMASEGACLADYLGVVPYGRALEMQQKLLAARADGLIPDVLLLLEHPPVFTIGRFRGDSDILAPADVLAEKGIEVFHTNRGGSVTYHGPGQLVGYPILNLKENGLGVREYIWKLEEVIIRLLISLGIEGYRMPEHLAGVWAEGKKVCSIGIRVAHYVTMHGFALNINDDLRHFDYINPCGIKGSNIMTSVSELLGKTITVEALVDASLQSFSEVFGLKCERGLERCLDIADARSG